LLVIKHEDVFIRQPEVIRFHSRVPELGLDRATSNLVLAVKIVILFEQPIQVLGRFLFRVQSWEIGSLHLNAFVLVLRTFTALSAPEERIAGFDVGGACLAEEHTFGDVDEGFLTLRAEHVSLVQEFFLVLRRSFTCVHLRLFELVRVSLVLLVAFEAESEIVALKAIKVELSNWDRLGTLIASIPHVKAIISHLIIKISLRMLLKRLRQLKLVIFLVFLSFLVHLLVFVKLLIL